MAEPTPLLNLESCLTAGAMFYGTSVKSVLIELADGRTQRLELPVSPVVEDDPADDLTPKQKAILQVIDEMKIGDVLSNEQVATNAGYSCSSDLRSFVKSVAMAGRLKPHRYGWERVK